MTHQRVVTLGEALGMFRTDGPNGFDRAGHAAVGVGGAEANVAIGLARLGVPAGWLGRVGDDELGRRIVREIRAEGVEVHAVIDEVASTGLMLKDSSRIDQTVVRFYRTASAGSRLKAQDVEQLRVEQADWLHVTGIPCALSSSAADAVFHAVHIARSAGVKISFDVNHRGRLWDYPEALPAYRRLLELADVVFGGEDELVALAGLDADTPPEVLARTLSASGRHEVVVKCGARGAGAWFQDTWSWEGAINVGVVDTVGAGDAFVAGYISARIEGASAAPALLRGVRNGAAACTHPGDWEGTLYRSELEAAKSSDPVQR